jgi:hypothetical protein
MTELNVVRRETTDPEDKLRKQAVEELRKRRELGAHTLAFIFVNAFLIVIWQFTGATFFWPVFPLFGWGIGLAFHAWDVLWPERDERKIRERMAEISRR